MKKHIFELKPVGSANFGDVDAAFCNISKYAGKVIEKYIKTHFATLRFDARINFLVISREWNVKKTCRNATQNKKPQKTQKIKLKPVGSTNPGYVNADVGKHA